MNPNDKPKPDIQYPCRWQYRLIGENREAILEAIRSTVDVDACTISDGNVSAGGRYLSLNLQLSVNDEDERLRLYQIFSNHPAIRVVL
jgi:putative lipoic acid-binding regulatory protein